MYFDKAALELYKQYKANILAFTIYIFDIVVY